MGLSAVISGGIILSVMMMLFFTLPGLTEKMFSIGDVTSQMAQIEKTFSDTEINMHHTSTLINNPTLNFSLSNDGQEKLWKFDEFDLFVTYEGATSGSKLTEELTYSDDCLGGLPAPGNWCIESITGDMLDPGILNSAEEANIRVQLNEDFADTNAVVSITTDNGFTNTVLTPYCGPSCYQMIWTVNSDENHIQWNNKPAAFTEFDSNNNFRSMFDLSDMSQWRSVIHIDTNAGTADCTVGSQYSTDGAVTWRGLDNGLIGQISTTQTSCDVLGDFVSAWMPLNATAQDDVWLRLVGTGGNGAADPRFGTVQLQFRS